MSVPVPVALWNCAASSWQRHRDKFPGIDAELANPARNLVSHAPRPQPRLWVGRQNPVLLPSGFAGVWPLQPQTKLAGWRGMRCRSLLLHLPKQLPRSAKEAPCLPSIRALA